MQVPIVAWLFGLFGALATLAGLFSGPWFFDGPILNALSATRTDTANVVVRFVTELGGHYVMIPVSGLAVLVVALKRRRTAIFLATALLGSALLNEIVKLLVQRPRPSLVEALSHPRGLSFPSGHSQASMALALGLALVLWRLGVRDRKRLSLFFLFPLLVGISRAYMGVHYPSDILAGWILAVSSLLLVHRLVPEKEPPMPPEPADQREDQTGSLESAP